MAGDRGRRPRPGSLLALSLGLLAPVPSAWAQAPTPVDVSVDATSAGAPLARVWAFHGYDEINYTTTAEGQALLGAIVAAHSAPVHVRSHFLLNTGDGSPALKWGSTNVYTEDAAGNPSYDWALSDGILDTLTGLGAAPFVELGFMPEALSVHPSPYRNTVTTSLDGGCFYPPTDYGKWAGLIRAFAAHAQQRYPDAAASWLWELWNEPDIAYWHGSFAEYAQLYDHTEAALHQVLPEAALGGPAVVRADGSFLTDFLQHCASGSNAVTGQTGTRLDLVTFHAKGGVTFTSGHARMDLGNQLRLHRAGFAAVSAFPEFRRTPIYITEADPDGCAACRSSGASGYAYRTSPAYGAYTVAMMKRTLELEDQLGVKLGGVLTWAFTFPGTPYFAGYRALASNGIHLPVLGAFQLLGRLDGARLPLTSGGAHALDAIVASGVRGEVDVDGLAARQGDAVRVLLWSYHDDIVDAPATPVRLTVHVPASFGPRVRSSHLRVDEAHGDAYTVWLAQGMPAEPSAAEREALEQAMAPMPLLPDQDLTVTPAGTVAVDFTLPRFAISLVTLTPAPGTTDGGDGTSAGGAASFGCSCSTGGPHPDAAGLAWLGAGTLLAVMGRRRAHARAMRPRCRAGKSGGGVAVQR